MILCRKKQKHCLPGELAVGDCWIGLTLAKDSGLILAGRVGKCTNALIEELFVSTEGKTDCPNWRTDGWPSYQRVLPPEVKHHIGKAGTQKLELTNGILRQQTGRWHRQQNKFAKVWKQTQVTARLVLSFFNWIWQHSRFGTTAAQRAGLASKPWNSDDFAVYPTLT
jgi:IS1 family transposase